MENCQGLNEIGMGLTTHNSNDNGESELVLFQGPGANNGLYFMEISELLVESSEEEYVEYVVEEVEQEPCFSFEQFDNNLVNWAELTCGVVTAIPYIGNEISSFIFADSPIIDDMADNIAYKLFGCCFGYEIEYQEQGSEL